MPSKNTTVLTIRVKNETAEILRKTAEIQGISVTDLINKFAENISENEETEKGVTPINRAICDDFEFEDLGFGRLLRALRKRNYPDRVIQRMTEGMLEQISDAGDYNPRRTREDWC